MKKSKSRSIFNKLFSSYLIIIFILPLMIFLFSLNLIRDHNIKILSDGLREKAVVYSPIVLDLYENSKIEKIDSVVKLAGNEISSRITVVAVGSRLGESLRPRQR